MVHTKSVLRRDWRRMLGTSTLLECANLPCRICLRLLGELGAELVGLTGTWSCVGDVEPLPAVSCCGSSDEVKGGDRLCARENVGDRDAAYRFCRWCRVLMNGSGSLSTTDRNACPESTLSCPEERSRSELSVLRCDDERCASESTTGSAVSRISSVAMCACGELISRSSCGARRVPYMSTKVH
jgi:hypothetical protein